MVPNFTIIVAKCSEIATNTDNRVSSDSKINKGIDVSGDYGFGRL
jgi:hypothetical protein